MKKYIVAFFFTAVFAGVASAGTHYIRPGAVGSNNGTDWTNAWTSIPPDANLTRGDTYYLADGSYGSRTFATAPAGSTYIYIKKATPSSHGTDIGWDDSYGNGVAAFNYIEFRSSYWDMDGSVGQWASDLPNYSAYGITVKTTSTSTNTYLIKIGVGYTANYINLSHMEVTYTNTSTWYNGNSAVYGYGTHWTFSYLWIHDVGTVCIYPISNNYYFTLEYSVLEKNGRSGVTSGEHSELIPLRQDYGILRYNIFRDWRSTGGVNFMANSGAGIYGCNHWEVYGNVFTQTGYWGASPGNSNGSLTSDSSTVNSDIKIYNNTFVNLYYSANVMGRGTDTNIIIKNNIFYNCVHYDSSFTVNGTTMDYNYYYNAGTSYKKETHYQLGTESILINPAAGNYHILANTNSGDSTIGAIYNKDPDGITRGVSGGWSRGAFEYLNGDSLPPGLSPHPPANISIN